jgi:hypothetical protein
MSPFDDAAADWTPSTTASTGLPDAVGVLDAEVTTGTTCTRSPGARAGGKSPAFSATATTSAPDAAGESVPISPGTSSAPATSATAAGRPTTLASSAAGTTASPVPVDTRTD